MNKIKPRIFIFSKSIKNFWIWIFQVVFFLSFGLNMNSFVFDSEAKLENYYLRREVPNPEFENHTSA